MSDFKAPFSQQQDVCHQIQKGGRGRLRRCVKEKISKEWISLVDDGINDSGLLQYTVSLFYYYCVLPYIDIALHYVIHVTIHVCTTSGGITE